MIEREDSRIAAPVVTVSGWQEPSGRRWERWTWLAFAALFLLTLPFDEPISQAFRPYRYSAFVNFIDNTLRWAGKGGIQIPALVLLIVVGAIFSRKLLRAGGKGLLAFAIAGILVNVIKVIVHRCRPGDLVAPPEHWLGYMGLYDAQSFPSGDTATTFAIAIALGAAYPLLRLPLLLLGGAIGIERVLLLSHYPSDAIAGAALGVAVGRRVLRPPRVDRRKMVRALPFVLLGLFAAAVLLGGLSQLPLLGRDESLYAEASREMLATHDWVTPRVNGQPFFEKPPLYYWLAGAAFQTFRPSPLATRLPAALLGIGVVLLTALIGARAWGVRAGILSGMVLLTSLQVAAIGRMGIMDVPLTFLTTAALLLYMRWRRTGRAREALVFGVVVGLGILLKAMAGLIPVLVAAVHLALSRRGEKRPWVAPALLAAAASVAVAAPWLIAVAAANGGSFGTTFFLHEHVRRILQPMQGHGGPFFYYLLLIPISFFPWIAFLPAAVRRPRPEESEEAAQWRGLALVWIGAVLLPFSLISTKLPGYVTPLFPAMALLVGAELEYRLHHPERRSWMAAVIGAAVLAVLLSLLPLVAVRLAPQAGATTEDVRRLTFPLVLWGMAYAVIAVGGLLGRNGRARAGVTVLVLGQTAALTAALFGLLPTLAPSLEGPREYLAAEVARRELPGSQVVLYDTRAEAVAFAIGHTVATFGVGQEAALVDELAKSRSALILPYATKNAPFLNGLPVRRVWKVGDRAVLEVDPVRALAGAPARDMLATIDGSFY